MARGFMESTVGKRAGFGEINLPAKQNGSSIMPGKVNPVNMTEPGISGKKLMGKLQEKK